MRIVTQEELDAAVVEHSIERWRSYCTDCAEIKASKYGCTSSCVRSDGVDWIWHGVEGEHPTPESVLVAGSEVGYHKGCPRHQSLWAEVTGDTVYVNAVHARAATLAAAINGEYDEDAERARLVAVPA